MLKLFRRWKKTQEEPAPTEAAAPETPSPHEGDAKTARPKRRRGTRGGRGRRKPAERPTATPAEIEAPSKPERKPATADRRAGARQRPARRRVEPRRRLPEARRELLVSVEVGEQRVAVLEDGQLAEIYLERPERRSIAGNIYLGVVDNVLPGMEAAFVEVGLEKNGFLYVDEIVVPELEGKRHGKKIQDLLKRGQTILVQAVKDPMKSKGARLTTEISLPGRFVVFVPQGEGLGVSRRLPDDERTRLKEIVRRLDLPSGGVIVRTAAEGASAEDVERDIVFLQKLWKAIQQRAEQADAPALVYQEAELPLRVVRDLFTGEFERALIDHERTYKRVVGYLKKTSPHMVERVERYREKPPLMEAYGVEDQVRSTLSRRVDLPSGGYLVFDYAEAFTIIDVNTGRFVGARGKGGNGGLEDTITKNNLEAVKEVVRQLRLRDIGGIIVIDFIDMANPKNRATVEEALRTELERDRTKTYVVEISPLGLVEMTRQNVTEGPRELLTKRCPTCGGESVVLSEASFAVDAERRLRALATGSRARAFRIELHPHVASVLIGPGASRLAELEAQTRRRFFLQPADGVALGHFGVLAQGKVEDLQPKASVAEGDEVELKLVEVGLHDAAAAVGKRDGYEICVAGAAAQVGKSVKVRIERVLDGSAYATVVAPPRPVHPPITAESEAEKPTRQPRGRKAEVAPEAREPAGDEEADGATGSDERGGEAARRKRRGGRGRRTAASEVQVAAQPSEEREPAAEPDAAAPTPRIHLPSEELDREDQAAEGEPAPEGLAGGEAGQPKKRTRRGTRGGRKRRKRTEGALADDGGAERPAESELTDASHGDGGSPEESADWEYVPMSEWEDDLR